MNHRIITAAALAAGTIAAVLVAAPAATAAPAIAVTGYQQVVSPKRFASPGHIGSGAVDCPTGTRVVGGGALVDSPDIRANLQFSYPASSTTWYAVVVNNAPRRVRFFVFAVCANHLVNYSIAHDFDESPANSQTSETTNCPTGTVPLGGGGGISDPSQDASINSSLPTAQGWRVDANNDTSTTLTKYAYVVCAKKPKGYQQVTSATVPVTPGTQTSVKATCPGTTKVFGGGGISSSSSPLVSLNSTNPTTDQSWITYESNGADTDNTITAESVCATVS